MSNKKTSKLEKWREKYVSFAVVIGCIYSVVLNWGDDSSLSFLHSIYIVLDSFHILFFNTIFTARYLIFLNSNPN
ncbi:hypothetical protein CWR45_06255 [Oceanobacillus chungangensis]|uniref:Uncharacterized protein n=1 Tax=Oceanobacillus chungangensis TaxID=1229152 RepID=A0A3D8PWM3_9BACI|nr:hypothetical protein CWR45_06255 [Oceanobacillus chungangensis]